MKNALIHANVQEMLTAQLEITKEFAHVNQALLVIHMVWHVLQVRNIFVQKCFFL